MLMVLLWLILLCQLGGWMMVLISRSLPWLWFVLCCVSGLYFRVIRCWRHSGCLSELCKHRVSSKILCIWGCTWWEHVQDLWILQNIWAQIPDRTEIHLHTSFLNQNKQHIPACVFPIYIFSFKMHLQPFFTSILLQTFNEQHRKCNIETI